MMNYKKSIIYMTDRLESSQEMYSLICLNATGLLITLNDTRCYLDGHYMLCLSNADVLVVNIGEYEAQTLHFLPYFYNVNLNHNVIGLSMYEEMRSIYGYPDFHLFRLRNQRFIGILRLNSDEYISAKNCFNLARLHIDNHQNDEKWSCRTRSDMISILRLAEGAYLGESAAKENEILRYIRDNIGEEITLSSLAKRFNTNRTTLTEWMNELTGMSPMQYVLEERLNQSCPDLLFTWISIEEISEKYGFSDVNYYIRAFKKRFGKTPLQYRKIGIEERIRSQTLYHEKEPKIMMKTKAFENYVCKGLGRAITLLKEQEDKSPFRKVLIDLIVSDKKLTRFLGQYEVDLIDCFEDRDLIAVEVVHLLHMNMLKGKNINSKIPLAVMLGYSNYVIEAAEKQYRKSYAELLEFTKRGDTDAKYPPCACEYCNAAAALARCKVDAERVKQILCDIADLYHYSDHPVIPEYQNPLFMMWDGYGKTALDRLLDEVKNEHPCGSKFKEHFPCAQLHTFHHLPKPLKNITAQDILNFEGFGDEYGRIYISFKQADKSVVREVAEQILVESDLKRQLYLLSFFTTGISPDIYPPAFPLDPTPLIQKFEQLEPSLYQEPHSELAQYALKFLQALCFIRHPSIKALGKRILDQGTDSISVYHRARSTYNCALRMYYGTNYTPEDRDSFAKLLLSECPYINDIVAFDIFVDLIKSKTAGAPLELTSYVYENINSSLRYDLVKALVEANALPKELKDECRFDSCKKTRELVKQI